ncbi:Lar family restriction alleviation protein [Xenorhabdus siamensis]|uniref:Lar family restriction alleviation protein n=1 Tax=Xenorhabdus siamensis TaxID=3136254 RepID=UPI003BF4DCFF
MTDELKPCPFCGSKNIDWSWFYTDGKRHTLIYCEDCPAQVVGKMLKSDAVKVWNQRANNDG